MGRVREGSFNLVFNQATLLPGAERGVAKSFPYPGRHTLTSPLSLSLSLPCSAHARKRRGKVVNANARREGGGRRRTALFLDFIQGYILLPFAAKDSARTSRVHFVGRGTSCLFNFFPPLLFLFPRFFPERKNVTFLSSREQSWTRMIFLIKEERMRRRL